MSLMLLAGAGLLLRSFIHVTRVDPGYDYQNTISLDISPRTIAYPDDQVVAFHERLMAEARTLPGVESVGAVDALPLSSNESIWSFGVVGRPPYAPGTEPSAKGTAILPGFFQTMRIPLLRGRDISEHDTKDTPKVIVVNQAFVREHFPNEEVLGKKLRFNDPGDPEDLGEIVGVVGDVRWRGMTIDPPATMFHSLRQLRGRRFMSIVVRAQGAEAMAPTLRALVRRIDRQQPIVQIVTLGKMRTESLATRRFNLILLAVLAIVALVLAAVGIFSVMNYTVTQRTSEIGIRMALGAEARDVFRLIVGNAVKLVVIGSVIGLIGALLSSRAIGSLLYGVKPADPWTLGAIVVVIAGTAMLASYLPARRAARVDPLVAIRYD
jgi:putative ABC transport system permease protein